MPPNNFTSSKKLSTCIDNYFNQIEDQCNPLQQSTTEVDTIQLAKSKKAPVHEPEPATIAGLTLYLGLNSRQEFEAYELNGKFAKVLKRGRLRIEAFYEKKLHQSTRSGAIFALKSMGWNDKTDRNPPASDAVKSLKIEIIDKGPLLAGSEKEVIL